MSRSTKKPWVKDPSNSYMKKIHARRMRRKIHQILQVFKQDQEHWDVGPYIPKDDEVTNPYDICDYIFYCPKCTRK